MSPKKMKQVYVPRFGSQSSSHDHSRKPQRDSQQPNVKITQRNNGKLVYKEVRLSPRKNNIAKVQLSPVVSRCIKKPNRMALKKSNQPTNKSSREKEASNNSTVSRGTKSDGDGDIFGFIDNDDSLAADKPQSKAEESVLRTIARMLLENRQIRRRLVTLSQQSQAVTGIN